MEDEEIVNLYWSRSETAICETSRKYGPMLSHISASLLRSWQDAEECVNDTYLAAWNAMPQERPTFLGAFLSKIVRRLSIDRFRREHCKKRGGMETAVEELTECVPAGGSMEEELENGRLKQTLNTFLGSLDEEKRTAFLRRYFYSDSLGEIAARLGCGEGKVKSMLFRIRAALHDRLEEEGLL